MKDRVVRILLLAAALCAAPSLACAAGTNNAPVIPTPHYPPRALHSSYVVEVNNRGQVVGIKTGTLSNYQVFDLITIGNALQMWIRRSNGSAVAGLFRVTYDYNPRTHTVKRHVSLISTGGPWANENGAATKMVEASNAQARKTEALLRAQQRQRESHLPDINAALRQSHHTASPSPRP